jgi:hypothetical protein
MGDLGAGLFQHPGRVALGQTDDAPQTAVRLAALLVEQALAYGLGLGSDRFGPGEQGSGLPGGIEHAFGVRQFHGSLGDPRMAVSARV